MIELRAATPDDAEAIGCVYVRAWQAGYRGLLPQQFLDAVRPAAALDTSKITVATVDNVVRGYVMLGPGQLEAIHVDPDAWGTGVGRKLLAYAREALKAQGHREAFLYVIDGNTRAERFYESDGWKPDPDAQPTTAYGPVVHTRRWWRAL